VNSLLSRYSNQANERWNIHQSKQACQWTSQEIRYGKFQKQETLMGTITFLNKDEKGKSVDQKVYRGMIGSLLYITASRLDIMFSVCLCAKYQSNPKVTS